MPMSIIDVRDGKMIKSFLYKQRKNQELEFVEQYNEKLLIKYKNLPLEIFNILNQNVQFVKKFEKPQAFIFVYEKEVFLALQNGMIHLYNSNGELLSNFNS